MTSPAWEDLDAFLSLDDFATTATFTTARGQVIPDVRGLFDDPQYNAELGEYDMNAGQPRFTCKYADVAALKKHDIAVIGGVTYALDHDPRHDGTGMAVLLMSIEPGGH